MINDEMTIGEAINSQMNIFENNYLKFHMCKVREVLVKNELSITDITVVLDHFIEIKHDIRDCFRITDYQTELEKIRKYQSKIEGCLSIDLGFKEEMKR